MVIDGRFIGRSLVCFVLFGLGLFASDPKCFEESGDKTVLKGDCKGSEVLVVESQQLKIHFKSTSLIESKPEFHLTIGGCKIAGTYLSTREQAIIQLGKTSYDLPVEMTITPGITTITDNSNRPSDKWDCTVKPKFEQDEETYTIKVDYAPMNPEKLGSLTITFDATIFDEEEDITAKVILAVIAALVILVAVIIVVVVIYCCCVKNKKSKKPTQPPQSTPAILSSSTPKQQPQAYVSRVQPIVEQIKAVEKKEEPMVKEYKQDEEKDKRGFQKLRVRSPQTMTIDSPAPSKQATVAPKKSFVKEPCHETVSKTIHITLPTNDKEEPVKDTPQPASKTRVLLLPLALAPKKLREHDPDTIAIEVPSKDKKEPVKKAPQPDSKKHVLLLPLALAPKKLREHDPDTIAVELPSESSKQSTTDRQKQQAFVAPDKPRGKRRRDHDPDTIAIEVPSTDKGRPISAKKDNMGVFGTKRGISKKEVKDTPPPTRPAASLPKKPGKNIEPTITMEFKVPSATTTESLDEQQN
ncbi:hypothetical protein M3Y95_01289700 [Aphelenchoides besseyi]|nr:hypothetical protein M3Y95_01289700 [Aphelenchoides besseyi]